MIRHARSDVRGLALILSFALLLLPSVAVGDTDAPNTCSAATTVATGTDWTTDSLTPAGDRDWYRFTLATATRVLVTLGGLRVNATLALYGACGTLLATSDRSGLKYEELLRTLPAGTYRLRVAAVGTASSGRLYGVRVRALPGKVVVLSSSAWVPYPVDFPVRPRIVGEVLNATTTSCEDVKIRIRFYDKTDTLITTSFTWARRERIRPGARSMFVWYGDDVPGYDHVRVSVAQAPVSSYPPLIGLVAHPGGSTPDGYGGLTYWGTLENTTAHLVAIPRVMVTVYDAWGAVRNAGFVDTEPEPMAAGASNPYEVYLGDRTTGNRVVITTHGYRN